jgi:hypothetical protein
VASGVGHHEPPELTRPEPLEERTLEDGDCKAGVVVAVVDRVVDAVVDCVVDAVVDCVAVDAPEDAVDCVVVAVAADAPENERAARAERPPVSTRPPASAPLVRLEMRRSPALRRSMGSGLMVVMIEAVPPRPLWSFWELPESPHSQEALRIRRTV